MQDHQTEATKRHWWIPGLLMVALFGPGAIAWSQDEEIHAPAMSFRNDETPDLDSLGDPLPAGALMRFGTERFQHPSSVTDLVLSRDDKSVITLSSNFLIGWDAETGKERWRRPWQKIGMHITGPAYGQRFSAFGRSSGELYTTGRSGDFYRFDAETGAIKRFALTRPVNPFQLLQAGRRDGDIFTSIDLTADEKQALLGDGSGLYLFDATTGKQKWAKLNRPKKDLDFQDMNRDRLTTGGDFSSGIFSPDDALIASLQSEAPQAIQLLKSDSGEAVKRIESNARIVRFCFSPDGKSIFTTERDCGICRYSVATGEREWRFHLDPDPDGAESYASAIDCSPDGLMIAAGAPIGSKYWIYLVDANTGEQRRVLKSDMWKPWAVQFSSDSRTLFSTGWDGVVRRWSVERGEELALAQGVRGTGCIAYSPNGDQVAFVDGDGNVRLVDCTSGHEVDCIQPAEAGCEALEFSPDGLVLYVGGGKDEHVAIQSWDLKQQKFRRTWKWDKAGQPHAGVEEIAASQGSNYVAAACFRQGKVLVWDAQSGESRYDLKHASVYGLAMDPMGQHLVTVGWDKQMRVWSLQDGTLLTQIDVQGHIEEAERNDLRMYTVTCSPNGNRLALAHMDGKVSVWDWQTREAPRLLRYSESNRRFTFGTLEYSPDGTWLAVGDGSGKVRLLNSLTGEYVKEVGQHSDYVTTIGFGADRKTLVSGGGGLSYLWSLEPDSEVVESKMAEQWDLLSGPELAELGSGDLHPYDAMCSLASSDEGVEYVYQRLRKSLSILDPSEITNGMSEEAAEKRLKLVLQAAEGDEEVELRRTVTRALCVFSLAGTAQAEANLEWLAEHHQNETMRELGSLVLSSVQVPARNR